MEVSQERIDELEMAAGSIQEDVTEEELKAAGMDWCQGCGRIYLLDDLAMSQTGEYCEECADLYEDDEEEEE